MKNRIRTPRRKNIFCNLPKEAKNTLFFSLVIPYLAVFLFSLFFSFHSLELKNATPRSSLVVPGREGLLRDEKNVCLSRGLIMTSGGLCRVTRCPAKIRAAKYRLTESIKLLALVVASISSLTRV